MPNQPGPTSQAGKAASSRNAMRHGLTNRHPVVTEAGRPEYEALREQLLDSLQPVGFLQEYLFEEGVACPRLTVLAMSAILRAEEPTLNERTSHPRA
jgi:hypothetical protein